MKQRRLWRLVSVVTILALVGGMATLVVPANPVQAATPIYVDASRPDDTGDGLSWATAKKYIQSGINIVDVAGTVYIAAGTYDESITVNKASLTIQGAGSAATIVTRSGGTPVMTITVNNVTVRDLTITDSIQLREGIRVSINGGATSGLTVENVEFININAGGPNAIGIYIYNDTSPTVPMSFSGLTVRNCSFRGTNTAAPSRNIGILAFSYLNLSNFYVENSRFSNLMTGLYMGRSSVDGVTFTNNEFGPVEQANYTGAPGGIYIGDSGSLLPTTYQNITVTNNNFHDYNRGVNIWNYANGQTIGRVDISNNTFANSIASSAVMLTARWNAGNASTMEGPISISNNTFTENQTIRDGSAMVDIRAGIESATSQVNVTDNTITFTNPTYGAAKYGMKFRGPVTNVTISGNTLDGNLVGGTSANMPPTSGIVFGTNDSTYGLLSSNAVINVTGNSIREFVHGIAIYDYVNNVYGALPMGVDLNINYDSIICNSEYGVISGAGEVTNAMNTWWGCNDGPGPVGPGSGEEVSSNVTFDPWLVLNLSSSAPVGDVSTITADMTDNSNGVDSGGWVPDDTEITFATTLGSLNPVSANTTSGIATSILTAADGGTATVSATAPTCYQCGTPSVGLVFTVSGIFARGETYGGAEGSTAGEALSTTMRSPSLKVISLRMQQTQVRINQPIEISANVVNEGGMTGSTRVALKINGKIEQTKLVTVGSGGIRPVKFTVTKAEPGTYQVIMGSQRASFVVTDNNAGASSQLSEGTVVMLVVSIVVVAFIVILAFAFRRRPSY